jgi:hypothetical protein
MSHLRNAGTSLAVGSANTVLRSTRGTDQEMFKGCRPESRLRTIAHAGSLGESSNAFESGRTTTSAVPDVE